MANPTDTKPNGGGVEPWSSSHVEVETDEKNSLEKIHSLADVDVENHFAFKGDDSDGKVDWTWRKMAATTFLCMLYTGRATLVISISHHSPLIFC